MAEHDFTLILHGDIEAHLDELFEVGCDDATFGSIDGVSYADFTRKAPSFADAIQSAITAIEGVDDLRVVHIEPDDLVTASDIADRLHRTRESIRLLIAGRRGRGDFPRPIANVRGRSRRWRWTDVLSWTDPDQAAMSRARVIAAANAMLELREQAAVLPEHELQAIARIGAKSAGRTASDPSMRFISVVIDRCGGGLSVGKPRTRPSITTREGR